MICKLHEEFYYCPVHDPEMYVTEATENEIEVPDP